MAKTRVRVSVRRTKTSSALREGRAGKAFYDARHNRESGMPMTSSYATSKKKPNRAAHSAEQ
ncbi:MAG: hypothetical protein QM658_01665 [Gordonia sp. (in: high G+C Gram-positive bacteria)]